VSEADFTIRLLVGLLLGSVIGLERQWRQRTAGLRTNALVTVGSTLFVALSIGMDEDVSPTRVAAQVVSGIGFLGAGVIIREGATLRGIDTAATLWCAAAIGSLAGAGLLLMAAGGTAAVIFLNIVLRPLAQHIESGPDEVRYRVRVRCTPDSETPVRALILHSLDEDTLQLQSLSSRPRQRGSATEVVADLAATARDNEAVEEMVERLSLEPSISAASWERLPDEEEDTSNEGRSFMLGRGR
jgi:putative Mg2+ transporter-C (MgtC) family protein